jgi:hypothetical protein
MPTAAPASGRDDAFIRDAFLTGKPDEMHLILVPGMLFDE